MKYARNRRIVVTGFRQHGGGAAIGVFAAYPAGFSHPIDDSGPASAAHVHRVSLVSVYVSGSTADRLHGDPQPRTIRVGDGAGEAYSPPGVGHPDPVSGWLWMAAGSGPIALTDFDFSEQTDVSELRRGRGTDAGRVCALAEPGAGRVLVERRTIEHRRGDTLRSLLSVGAWGAPFFRGLQRMWSKRHLFRREISPPALPIRRVRLLRPRRVRRPRSHTSQ